jgi:tRNA(Arg) A34 adenosine deaminase TadA
MNKIEIGLPAWLRDRFKQAQSMLLSSPTERMELAISISRDSVAHGGGPFGALIYDPASSRVISVGANMVIPQQCSLWHAEVVAIYCAQHAEDSHNLKGSSQSGLEIYSSCEPCMMCQGAVFWSGIQKLYYAAQESDARAIGFD